MKKDQWLAAAWSGFLGAAVLEMLIFAVLDPAEFHLPLLGPHPSNMSIYAAAFFIFWLGTSLSSALTALLLSKNIKATDTL